MRSPRKQHRNYLFQQPTADQKDTHPTPNAQPIPKGGVFDVRTMFDKLPFRPSVVEEHKQRPKMTKNRSATLTGPRSVQPQSSEYFQLQIRPCRSIDRTPEPDQSGQIEFKEGLKGVSIHSRHNPKRKATSSFDKWRPPSQDIQLIVTVKQRLRDRIIKGNGVITFAPRSSLQREFPVEGRKLPKPITHAERRNRSKMSNRITARTGERRTPDKMANRTAERLGKGSGEKQQERGRQGARKSYRPWSPVGIDDNIYDHNLNYFLATHH